MCQQQRYRFKFKWTTQAVFYRMCFLLAICCSWQPRILRPLLRQPLGLEHTQAEFINVSKLLRWSSRILKCNQIFFWKWLMWKKPDLVGLDFSFEAASALILQYIFLMLLPTIYRLLLSTRNEKAKAKLESYRKKSFWGQKTLLLQVHKGVNFCGIDLWDRRAYSTSSQHHSIIEGFLLDYVIERFSISHWTLMTKKPILNFRKLDFVSLAFYLVFFYWSNPL